MACCATVGRMFLTLLMAVTWNVATTHCAFTAAAAPATPQTTEPQADECPMHAASKKAAPEPTKKKGCDDSPCCKTLPAAAAKSVFASKSAATGAWLVYPSTETGCRDCRVSRSDSRALDTGPPAPTAFIKVVLQRSTPAHAPPLS
jgi:hypothetical protein